MATTGEAREREPVLVIHGGAGPTTRSALDPAQRTRALDGLCDALEAGRRVLVAHGSALEAVIAAVAVLEDDPAFNAGRGAVLRDDGSAVLDASVMWGADRSAGAVAGVRRVRNPVRAAERVRSRTPHVLLAGLGADGFAESEGLELVAPDYFLVPAREAQLQSARESGRIELDRVDGDARALGGGTVGAVALDLDGHLAAATSTGGMTNAFAHRIGDSPLVGAGTWADDRFCAVSATGAGEFFIRAAFAHQVAMRIQLEGSPLDLACERALADALDLGGRGGCIAIDPAGRVAMPCNTASMPRGVVRGAGSPSAALFADDPLEASSR